MSVDFYPTPPDVIARMLERVDWQKAAAILEPSAGKGDLADAIKRRSEAARGRYTAGVDCIEIDPNLQHLLRGKGHNVIHDDFLTFQTVKQYDAVIANFPFSEGDRHLVHAIHLLGAKGGQLVALVNAETLRNPYSRDRQWLTAWLDKHGAQITEIEGAFLHAERPTDVTVALVVAQIPRALANSSDLILDRLIDATEAEAVYDNATQSALVDGDPVQNMLAHFALECRAGAHLIAEYDALKPLMLDRLSLVAGDDGDKFAQPIIELKIDAAYSDNRVNAYVRATRHKYWHALIGNPRFRSSYTSTILTTLDGKLEHLANKDFTLFNIRQLDADLRGELPASIEDAILSLFDELSRKYAFIEGTGNNIHYYTGWKSNRAHKINRKVILPINGFGSWWMEKRGLDTRYIQNRLADMIKVFQYLDGKPVDAEAIALERVKMANETSVFRNLDCHYFTATFFKKGTCHIQFRDQDLLDRFNIFGSQRKGWLPPSYGRKRYREMDAEEQAVIDEFQGEAAYEVVIERPDAFLARPGLSQLAMEAA
jgi:hypothetical protein